MAIGRLRESSTPHVVKRHQLEIKEDDHAGVTLHSDEKLQQAQKLVAWVVQGPSQNQARQEEALAASEQLATSAAAGCSMPYTGSLLSHKGYAVSVVSATSSAHYPRSLLSQREYAPSVASSAQRRARSNVPVKARLAPTASAQESYMSRISRAAAAPAGPATSGSSASLRSCGLRGSRQVMPYGAAVSTVDEEDMGPFGCGCFGRQAAKAAKKERAATYQQSMSSVTVTAAAPAGSPAAEWWKDLVELANQADGQPGNAARCDAVQPSKAQQLQLRRFGSSGLLSGLVRSSQGVTRKLWEWDIRADDGSIRNMPLLLQLVQQGGVAQEIRSKVWPVLLGLLKPADTHSMAATKFNAVRTEYELLLGKVQTQVEADVPASDLGMDWDTWSDICTGVLVDSERTSWDGPLFQGKSQAGAQARLERLLLVKAAANPHTGYVQGMADLAIPFLYVFPKDAEAYAMFSCLMAKMQGCFAEGMPGLVKQLQQVSWLLQHTDKKLAKHIERLGSDCILAAFQMLLLLFRREFHWDDGLLFWEVLWAYEQEAQCGLAPYVAAALFLSDRRNLLRLRSSDEVLNWAHSLILDPLPAAAAGFKLWRKLADEIELREIRRAALGR